MPLPIRDFRLYRPGASSPIIADVSDQPPPATIEVFLVDDHQVVREGLRHLLEVEDDMVVVGEAGTADDAIEGIRRTHPRVAVLDVRLSGSSGVEVCREVRSENPDIACLMLTSFSDDEAFFDAIMAGASGYVLKEVRGSDLVSDIRRVASGHSLLDPDLTAQIVERVKHRHRDDEVRQLTQQEQRIIENIAQGMTNRQIAAHMFLSEKTVKNYVSNLLAKLGLNSRTEAAVYSLRHQENRRS